MRKLRHLVGAGMASEAFVEIAARTAQERYPLRPDPTREQPEEEAPAAGPAPRWRSGARSIGSWWRADLILQCAQSSFEVAPGLYVFRGS